MMRCLNFFFLAACSTLHFDMMTDTVARENRKLQQKYHLIPFGFGSIGPGEIKAYSFDQNIYLEPDISEARSLLVHYMEDLKVQINKSFAEKNLHKPIDEKFFSIAIDFIDESRDTIIKDGKVSRVTQNDGLIRYKVLADDRWHYKTIYEETYQEALKIVQEAKN
jgi:hypothetical protein